MKLLPSFALSLTAVACLFGCRKEPSAEQILVETFQAQPAEAPAQNAPAPAANPVASTESLRPAVEQALVDMRAQNYSAAATRLDAVAASPRATPAQIQAAQDAQIAMEQELMRRARNGDQQALKALQDLSNRPKYAPGGR